MQPRQIAIIGLGLMGGSLAAACRRHFPRSRLIGISRKSQVLQFARRKKWIHQGVTQVSQGVASADLVILCTPVDTLMPYLELLDRHCRPGTLVTDVGSVKSRLFSQTERRRWQNIRYVSAHPMVGSHERGVSAARPDLYEHGYTFVIRSAKTNVKALNSIRQFWKKISGRVITLSPQEHDRVVAQISHLPHLLAVCLILALPKKVLAYAGPGFRDVTRIAQGHPDIWLPILMHNRAALLNSVRLLERSLSRTRQALDRNQVKKIAQMLRRAAQIRSEI